MCEKHWIGLFVFQSCWNLLSSFPFCALFRYIKWDFESNQHKHFLKLKDTVSFFCLFIWYDIWFLYLSLKTTCFLVSGSWFGGWNHLHWSFCSWVYFSMQSWKFLQLVLFKISRSMIQLLEVYNEMEKLFILYLVIYMFVVSSYEGLSKSWIISKFVIWSLFKLKH